MEINIPDALDFWFGLEVIVSRGYKKSLLITRVEDLSSMIEKGSENLLKTAEKTLTHEQARDMFLSVFRPTKLPIRSHGDLSVPDHLAEWLVPASKGRLRFRGGDEEIHIDRSSCLCDNPTCAKCLGGNCKDPGCWVHRQSRKTAFMREHNPAHRPSNLHIH